VERTLPTALFAFYQFPELVFSFSVSLVSARFIVFLHQGKNPLNCATANGTFIDSKLPRQLVEEIGTHTKDYISPESERGDCTDSAERSLSPPTARKLH